MLRDDILRTLKAAEQSLRAKGVAHAALFGSTARGDARPGSDIDIMIEVAPECSLGVFGYLGIVHTLTDMFPVRVDVSDRAGMKHRVRSNAERDAIYAF